MTSIPAPTWRNHRNNFKRHYLPNKRFSLNFLLHFWNVRNLKHFQKKDEYPSLIISEIIDAERRGYLNV